MHKKTAVVAGGGGFIGGHLVAMLLKKGYQHIRAIDIKPLSAWYQVFPEVDNIVGDMSLLDVAKKHLAGASEVYNLAADMGGMGFIEKNRALCMLSVLINTHMLMAAKAYNVEKYFYASSACVYNVDKQRKENTISLKETDAYPAQPEDGYGWEKLFSERMCRHFQEDFGMHIRIARFHNIYGPYGTWEGGREKAPAALCRKVKHASVTGNSEIEIWGSGNQTRSFTYIEDCIQGIFKIMQSDIQEPINLGSSESVTINQLLDIIANIANVNLIPHYNTNAPKGVGGRCSDNTQIQNAIGWEPRISLSEGMAKTYDWISGEYHKKYTKSKEMSFGSQ